MVLGAGQIFNGTGKTFPEKRSHAFVNRLIDRSIIITFPNVFHEEFRTGEFPFNIGPIIDLIDGFFQHRDQRVDQDCDTDKGE